MCKKAKQSFIHLPTKKLTQFKLNSLSLPLPLTHSLSLHLPLQTHNSRLTFIKGCLPIIM